MTEAYSFGEIFTALGGAVNPALPALIHGDQTTSWSDFDRRTDTLAATLLASGVTTGDKVAHLMRNSPAYLETTVAGFKARLVHVNVNYRYTGEELFYILDNSDAAVLVFDGEFASLVTALLPRLPGLKLALQVGGATISGARDFEAVFTSPLLLPPQDHAADDLLFIYTGGTTGVPKGVMWEQSAIWALCGGGAPALGLAAPPTLADHVAQVTRGDGCSRALIMPPLMHGSGFLIAIYTLARGGTVITLPGQSFEAADAFAACARHTPDYSVIVGDAFARPLLRGLDAGQGDIASIRVMISSGTMWSPEVKAGLLRHNPELMIVDALSSSESIGMGASVHTAANPDAATRFVYDENTLVLDDNMCPVVPGSGQMGRIARGGLIPRGYYKDPEKSARTFVAVDGRNYSLPGDWATVEADGTIVLLGRGSQCINTGGEKVFPEEVEEALKTHPAVEDALVFGTPDEKWGQRVTAVVEGGVNDLDALTTHVRGMLAGYKTPKHIVLVAKVPRAQNGKADYEAAKAMVG